MLQINGIVLNIDDYHITYEYDGGEYLDIDILEKDPAFKQITERAIINSENNNYLITKIDGSRGRSMHISAEVDRRDFQKEFYENFENESAKLSTVVATFLPTGWTFVNNGNTTNYRTLRLEYGTALDLLNNCAALYNVRFLFNAQTKTLTAVNPDGYEQNAAFVTEELNLTSLQYYGDASDYITRLEARGKDGMTFVGAVVDGQTISKSYVEDYTYSQDIVYGYWKDDRYTVKEDLYQAAKEKLAELAIPKRSYECNVIDLKSIDPEKYSAFDLSLYQRIALKDVSRETSYVYQVIKVVKYPFYPEKNIITLSTTPPSISQKLTDIEETAIEATNAAASATSWMTDSQGGKIYFVRDNDGDLMSMILKVGSGQNPPVWVFNQNGIGYSSSGASGTPVVAMTADGNVKASSMETGEITGGATVTKAHKQTRYIYDDNGNVVAEVETIIQDSTQKQVLIDLEHGTITMLDVETGDPVFDFNGETLTVNKGLFKEWGRAEKGFICPYGWSYGFSPDNDLSTRNSNMRIWGAQKTVDGVTQNRMGISEADHVYFMQRSGGDGTAHAYFKLDNESTLLIDKVYLLSEAGMQSLANQLRAYL